MSSTANWLIPHLFDTTRWAVYAIKRLSISILLEFTACMALYQYGRQRERNVSCIA